VRAGLLVALFASVAAQAMDALEGTVALQSRFFAEPGTLGQDRLQPSAALTLAADHSWNDGADALSVTLFGRADALDDARTRADLREAYYSHRGQDWALNLGVRRVFWGQTEAKHLVDVINQVDFVEDLDEEERLGQPMAQLVLERDAGRFELFLLPGFRPRTFPSTEGRLGGPVDILRSDDALVAARSALNLDWALRWSRLIGDLELALGHFDGTSREPGFEVVDPVIEAGRPIRLRPVYPLVSQTSLDAQYLIGQWALKLEAFTRGGDGPRSVAVVAGFEHTRVGVLGTRADLGLLVEVLRDNRGDRAPLLAFERDVFLGARLALNDFAGTSLLAGLIRDRRTREEIWILEGRRRLGDRWALGLELRAFSGVPATAPGDLEALLDPRRKLGVLADDDYLQLELTRYF
jgi:hypothetical protein